MSEDPQFSSLYNKALRFLGLRPRSEKEVRDFLAKKSKSQYTNPKSQKVDEGTIEKIISKLKGYKFIDDVEFTRFWVENRRKGRRLIELELKRKGIDKEVIENVLTEFDMAKKDEDLLNKLFEKKLKTLKGVPRQKSYERMMRFLLSRGFEYDDVKKIIDAKLR